MIEFVAGVLILISLGFFRKKKKEIADYPDDVGYSDKKYVEIEVKDAEKEENKKVNTAYPG